VNEQYQAWNRALAARFLQSRKDEPLYLYTDEAVLQEVAGEAGADSSDALEAFLSAVRATLVGEQPFSAWERRTRVLPSSDPVPAHLAVLCFLVLVAVEREDTHFSYYPGLNKALGRSTAAGPPPGFTRDVELLFARFNDWLIRTGNGIPTAAKSASYPHVSWPLSQAVVRPSDRALLVRIFLVAGLTPGAARDGAALRASVLPRLQTAGESPSRTRLLELALQHRELFDTTLSQVYSAWDGTSRLVAGPQFSNLRLCHEELTGDWWLLGSPVPGTVGQQWHVGSATGTVRANKGFEASPADLWSLVGRGVVGRVEGGPKLRSPDRALRWLSIDTRAGGWAEVGGRDVQLEQYVVTAQHAAGGLARVAGVEDRGSTPSGLAVYFVPQGVALPDLPVPSVQPEPRFRGGLPLRVATHSYLLSPHGAPDVVQGQGRASVGGEDTDSSDILTHIDALAAGPGDHAIEIDGHTLRFRLVDRLLAPGDGQAGAAWYDDLPTPVGMQVPHAAGPVWVLGADGAVEERDVPHSRWLDDVSLFPTAADVTVIVRSTQFEPLFVISRPTEGTAWVTAVPDVLRAADPDAGRRSYDRLRARQLVTQLLADVRPAAMRDDRAWKKALAALMREVHR
jgi:hypothetical protein